MVAAGVMEEDERVELIGGELVPMSPKGIRHEVVKRALLDRWIRARPEEVHIAPETTFRLSEDTYLEPDVVIYPRASGLQGLTGASVLLVVEIADSSLRYDIGRKAALYASFGIRELWVIDAVRLTARVFREPAPDGYRDPRDFVAAERLVPLVAPEAFALRLDALELE
jgi:Uma2 family endonuclease